MGDRLWFPDGTPTQTRSPRPPTPYLYDSKPGRNGPVLAFRNALAALTRYL